MASSNCAARIHWANLHNMVNERIFSNDFVISEKEWNKVRSIWNYGPFFAVVIGLIISTKDEGVRNGTIVEQRNLKGY